MKQDTQKQETAPVIVNGVDVSKAFLDVGRKDGSWQMRFSNDAKGIKALLKEALARYDRVIVGLEPSGGNERGLIDACHKAGLEVRFADARRVRCLANAHNVPAKTDAIDARFIARFIEEGGGRVIKPNPSREALADVMHTRTCLVEERVRLGREDEEPQLTF